MSTGVDNNRASSPVQFQRIKKKHHQVCVQNYPTIHFCFNFHASLILLSDLFIAHMYACSALRASTLLSAHEAEHGSLPQRNVQYMQQSATWLFKLYSDAGRQQWGSGGRERHRERAMIFSDRQTDRQS